MVCIAVQGVGTVGPCLSIREYGGRRAAYVVTSICLHIDGKRIGDGFGCRLATT